jgi:ribosomal protein S18 acetylase RimI-like enzyme
MIRPFSLFDLESILQIENRSFPKSPYDWITFLNLHTLYPETFLVYVDSSTLQLEASGSASTRTQAERLRVDPESRPLRRNKRRGLGVFDRVRNNNDGQRGEKILGYIVFSQDGHILSIAVHPRHRRKGIGRELLQRAMRTSPLKKVWAEVRRGNQGAQAFYSKMGFQMTGWVPNYYGNEDALIVQRTPVACESY